MNEKSVSGEIHVEKLAEVINERGVGKRGATSEKIGIERIPRVTQVATKDFAKFNVTFVIVDIKKRWAACVGVVVEDSNEAFFVGGVRCKGDVDLAMNSLKSSSCWCRSWGRSWGRGNVRSLLGRSGGRGRRNGYGRGSALEGVVNADLGVVLVEDGALERNGRLLGSTKFCDGGHGEKKKVGGKKIFNEFCD